MAVKVAEGELVLDALLENPSIKAAVLVDSRGYVVEKRGAAASLKLASSADKTTDVASSTKKAPNENLYLVQAGNDYLVVVFEDHNSFERLKSAVDGVLGEFGLAPSDE